MYFFKAKSVTCRGTWPHNHSANISSSASHLPIIPTVRPLSFLTNWFSMMAQEMAMTVWNIFSHLAFGFFTKSCNLHFRSLVPCQSQGWKSFSQNWNESQIGYLNQRNFFVESEIETCWVNSCWVCEHTCWIHRHWAAQSFEPVQEGQGADP